jgi:hypothetical protein
MIYPPKSTNAFCNPVLGRYQLQVSCLRYFVTCLVITILVRALQSFFKAQAFKYESDSGDSKGSLSEVAKPYWSLWWKFFTGFKLEKHSDLFLPTFIGWAELAAYPVLFVLGQYLFIGAWLGIKTAGSWKGWQTSGTAYNRFLLFNLLNLGAAYFFLTPYVERIPCP